MLATGCILLVSANKGTYNYAYGVNDPNTGDVKEQQESRGHDQVVSGYYKTLDADGLMRTVNYRADPINGFQAQVDRDQPGAMAPMTGPSQPIMPISPPAILRSDSDVVVAASPSSVDCLSDSITPAPIQRIVDIEPARMYAAVSATPRPMLNVVRPTAMEIIDYAAPATWQTRLETAPAPILRAKLLESPQTIPAKIWSPRTGWPAPYDQSYAYHHRSDKSNAIEQLAAPQYYAAPEPLALTKYYTAPAPLALPKYYTAPTLLALPKYYSSPAPLALAKSYAAPAPMALPKYYSAPTPQAVPKYYASAAPLIAPLDGPKYIPALKTAPVIVDAIAQEPCEK